MARKFIPDEASSFYPPRARWYAGVFYLGSGLRRRLALDRLTMPQGMRLGEVLAGFLVPGLAVYFCRPRFWGQAALGACGVLFLVYVAWLGHPAANLAFGLLMSIHSTGFVFYCNPLMAAESFRSRLAFSVLVLLAMLLLLYWPARDLIQKHWLTPLQYNGQVIVVRRDLPALAIQRGEWVAYSLAEFSKGLVHFHGGAGFGPVLAVGGDQVVFSTNGFSVNGVLYSSLPHMPASGEWVVPEKHWFIWPNLAISGHGNVGEQNISSAFMAAADVSPNQFLGQPFQRWFWRKQTLTLP